MLESAMVIVAFAFMAFWVLVVFGIARAAYRSIREENEARRMLDERRAFEAETQRLIREASLRPFTD